MRPARGALPDPSSFAGSEPLQLPVGRQGSHRHHGVVGDDALRRDPKSDGRRIPARVPGMTSCFEHNSRPHVQRRLTEFAGSEHRPWTRKSGADLRSCSHVVPAVPAVMMEMTTMGSSGPVSNGTSAAALTSGEGACRMSVE